MKESTAVERLTRLTILLGKVTIIFLPVSLMTAYFSTQMKDVQFTVRSYWISFSIIVGLSIIFLALFGVLSDTAESPIIYRSFSQKSLDVAKKTYRMMRQNRKNVDEKMAGSVRFD